MGHTTAPGARASGMNFILLATALVGLLGGYLVSGLVFAIPFIWSGAARIDPHAARGTWGFRILIVPGAILLWPLLLRRWLRENRRQPGNRDNPVAHPPGTP